MVGTTVLHYTIVRAIGSGAMGEVYLAEDTRTARRVALKFVGAGYASDREAHERLVREARAAARLSHAGIVGLYGLEEDGDRIFLVEEFVEGETLAHRLERGPLSGEECLRLARVMSAALAHAHARGVLHRDLKPDNVLIGATGEYKIADFGIAVIEGATSLTATGTVLGSLPYLAPERVRGHAGDARSDLFSLGTVLYEAMTGRRAFGGATEAEVMYAVLNETTIPIGTSPQLEPLAQLVTRLLAKEPGRRPSSAEVVLGVLEGVEATAPARRARPKAPWWIPAAAAATLVLIGAVIFWHGTVSRRGEGGPPSIAVLYFDNLADPSDGERMGAITGNLLITSLAQTADVNVLSTQSVLDAMRGVAHGDHIDRSQAFEVARRARARRVVTGTILQTTPTIVMTAEVSDVGSGKLLLAERVEGRPGQTIFQVVDQLGSNLLHRMVRAAETQSLPSVSQRTSTDLQAQRAYADGMERLSRGEIDAAMRSFQAAVTRDTTFAQAYYGLAIAQWWSNEPQSAAAAIAHAREYSSRLSASEHQTLEGLSDLVASDFHAAGVVFRRLIEQTPGDKLARYGLVESAFHSNDFTTAAREAEAAIAIDPDFTLAGVHLVDALLEVGRGREADSIGTVLLRRDPGNMLLRGSLFTVRVSRADGEGALRLAHDLPTGNTNVGKPIMGAVSLALSLGHGQEARAWILRDSAVAIYDRVEYSFEYMRAMRDGRFRAAIDIARRAWAVTPPFETGTGPSIPVANGLSAAVALGDSALAMTWADSAAIRFRRWGSPAGPTGAVITRPTVLARLGKPAAAEAALHEAELQLNVREGAVQRPLHWTRASVRESEHRGTEALEELKGATYFGPYWWAPAEMLFARGRNFLLAGRPTDAVASLDSLLRIPCIEPDAPVRARFYRAQALERLGRNDEALAGYRDFLALWKKADAGAPGVAEARVASARLTRLQPAAVRTAHP
jgi:tetratricopeptide (TPR) repeat protein